ncbi:hypothetical protein [Hoeflea sp.]|uniref:hypothetical protein n=1 Tax=Hoeflea sp. TaxID=1940281 RepID=UPI003B018545
MTAARWQQFLTAPVGRGDTQAAANARAFALAQERYHADDYTGTKAALVSIDRMGGAANHFERHFLSEIRRGLAYKGAFGAAKQTRLLWNHRLRMALCYFGFGLGLLIVLARPLRVGLREIAGWRLLDLNAAREKMKRVATVTTAVAGKAYVPAAFQRQDSKAISSHSKANARDAIRTLAARFDEFAYTSLVFFAVSLAAYYLYRLFQLPDAGQNTAFELVALPSGIARDGADAGFLQASLVNSPGAIDWLLSVPFTTIILLAATVAAFILFKSRLPALLVLVASLLLGVLAPHLIAPQPRFEVNASAVDEEHRLALESQIVRSSDEISLALRPAINSNDAAAAAENPQTGATGDGHVRPAARFEAAFVLAQLAYIENKPAEAARILETIDFEAPFIAPYQTHRLQLIRAWAEARGYGASLNVNSFTVGISPTVSRIISYLFGAISAGALAAGIALCALCAFVYRRRSSLLDMLDNAPSAARVEPDRLGRILGR